MTTTLLKVSGLKVAYGGIQAVKGISFEVRQGELVSLIGANGAGKTTTLKAITGTQPVADGEIEFMGQKIKGQGAWDLVKQGLVMVPEGRGTFTRMTITENLQMGAFVRNDREIDADIEKVFAIFPRLKERAKQLAGTMSGGEQQMLAMGRALMSRPKSTRSSRWWPISTAAAPPCCWWSRTPAARSAWPTGVMSWSRARSPWTARPRRC